MIDIQFKKNEVYFFDRDLEIQIKKSNEEFEINIGFLHIDRSYGIGVHFQHHLFP
ncbi:MAG TPA: hypothetical protein VN704_06370 [Verrucomicrobiae bacterium]|nr:hypothetical protein [Verrucomicrobiae bacterium]